MAKTKTLEGMDLVNRAAGILFSKKVVDAILIDLHELSSITDYYLICTCQNEAQMKAVLNHLSRALSREGAKALRSEYRQGVRWAVLDYGELIVHLFEKDTRNYYSLERLWADAKVTPLKAEDYITTEEDSDSEDDEL